MEGTLIKGIAGFYYVWTEEAIYECKARGKFRNKGLTPMVGDKVIVSLDPSSSASNPSMKAGTVDEILPRHNELERPPISNVDICVIVTAAKDPVPLTYIIDRMSVAALLKECEIVICINKADLDEGKAEELKSIYETLFPVVIASTKLGQGMEDLKRLLLGKQSALCGPSGVGKSSLTNKLLGEGFNAITGEISEKTLRGKNTTRHSSDNSKMRLKDTSRSPTAHLNSTIYGGASYHRGRICRMNARSRGSSSSLATGRVFCGV